MDKLISMDSQGAHIVSEEVEKKLAKKKISPSMITALEGCSARWLADSFVLRDLIPQDSDNPATRGSLFHKIMEELFALPAEERTIEKVKEITAETFELPEFEALKESPEAVSWVRDAINGYYSMGGKPENVQIAKVSLDGKEEELGLEIFVDGQIGNTSRKILGFIDQLSVDTKDSDAVVVNDWKSGAKAKKWNPKTKSTDGLAEQRQQILYSMLLEQKGVKVSQARLIYPVAREIINVQLEDEGLKERIIKDVEKTDAKLNHLIENNTFEYTPNFLCSWCALVKICPRGQTNMGSEKMRTAFQSQPEPEVLTEAIEIL